MILYLTYNDQPSGVYWSQVTDVVQHLNSIGPDKVKLIALVSGRGFLGTRSRIRDRAPDAWVLPMYPQMKNWRKSSVMLRAICWLLRPSGIMARGVIATALALRIREKGSVNKVCFDGRGAYAAEWEEYRIIDNDALIRQFRPLEADAVRQCDFRLAVSHALVRHWRERYAYTGDDHVVIPCTLGLHFRPDQALDRESVRKELGYSTDDIVLVYAGSTAGWQSFALLEQLLGDVLDKAPKVKVLFLSKADPNNERLVQRYPGRVQVHWLPSSEVYRYLSACDHGILVREATITNRVASPTKFAEYLAAGLPVIISPGLGDFSSLVLEKGLGMVVNPDIPMELMPTDQSTRSRMQAFAISDLSKAAYDAAYLRTLGALH